MGSVVSDWAFDTSGSSPSSLTSPCSPAVSICSLHASALCPSSATNTSDNANSGTKWLIVTILQHGSYCPYTVHNRFNAFTVCTSRPRTSFENGDASPGLTVTGHRVSIGFCITELTANTVNISL